MTVAMFRYPYSVPLPFWHTSSLIILFMVWN